MPRRARKLSPTNIYHIILRGINKSSVFGDKIDKQKLLYILTKKSEELDIEIYAYCIMDTHLHILLKSELDDLILYMKKVNITYARYYNTKFNRTGYVFENRYKSQCIDSEEYFWGCLRYIHQNPIKAHMAHELKQYTYSSFREFYYQDCSIIHPTALQLYRNVFPDTTSFQSFHREYSNSIFLDVEEDSYLFNLEITTHELSKIQQQYGFIEKSDILQYKKSKQDAIATLKEMLHLSTRNVHILIKESLMK